MSSVFFIADPHFGHKNIIDYESRPFKSVEEMDETLIKNWNNTVSKTDKIFILGDFSFYSKERIYEIVTQLNGIKILVLGNHDRIHSVQWWKDVGFNDVSKNPIIYNNNFILSHEPFGLEKYMPYFNIYGHVHWHKNYMGYGKKGFCVCIERIGYKPISWDEIMERIVVK